MLASEARKNASEIIWNSLPSVIRHNIEDAVNEGKLKCEISFNEDNVGKFNDSIEYFHDLEELGYTPMMNKVYDKYVITIMW
jgi:hypothetical protein